MKTLDDASRHLRDKGYYTRTRDWSIGHSLMVSRGVVDENPEGIQTLDGLAYIAEPGTDGKWWVYLDIKSFPVDTLSQAVEAVVQDLKEAS